MIFQLTVIPTASVALTRVEASIGGIWVALNEAGWRRWWRRRWGRVDSCQELCGINACWQIVQRGPVACRCMPGLHHLHSNSWADIYIHRCSNQNVSLSAIPGLFRIHACCTAINTCKALSNSVDLLSQDSVQSTILQMADFEHCQSDCKLHPAQCARAG